MEYQYSKKFFIGYGDVDSQNHCKLSKIIELLQNAATMHSKVLGYGTKGMMDLKQAWLMLGWHVKILKYPVADMDVEITTWCRTMKGVEAKRGYEVLDENGETLIIADSSWALFDLVSQKLIRVPQDMVEAYNSIDRDPFDGIKSEKLHDNDINQAEFKVKVGKRDIDTNHHMNNAKYMEYAMEVLPEDRVITEFENAYKKQIPYGEEITVSYGDDMCRIKNEKGEVCFILKIK